MTKSSTAEKSVQHGGKIDRKKLKSVRGGSGAVTNAVYDDVSDAALDIIVHEEITIGGPGNPVGDIQTKIVAEFSSGLTLNVDPKLEETGESYVWQEGDEQEADKARAVVEAGSSHSSQAGGITTIADGGGSAEVGGEIGDDGINGGISAGGGGSVRIDAGPGHAEGSVDGRIGLDGGVHADADGDGASAGADARAGVEIVIEVGSGIGDEDGAHAGGGGSIRVILGAEATGSTELEFAPDDFGAGAHAGALAGTGAELEAGGSAGYDGVANGELAGGILVGSLVGGEIGFHAGFEDGKIQFGAVGKFAALVGFKIDVNVEIDTHYIQYGALEAAEAAQLAYLESAQALTDAYDEVSEFAEDTYGDAVAGAQAAAEAARDAVVGAGKVIVRVSRIRGPLPPPTIDTDFGTSVTRVLSLGARLNISGSRLEDLKVW